MSQKDTVLFGGVANDNKGDDEEEERNDDVVIETKEDLPPLVEVATGEEGDEVCLKNIFQNMMIFFLCNVYTYSLNYCKVVI